MTVTMRSAAAEARHGTTAESTQLICRHKAGVGWGDNILGTVETVEPVKPTSAAPFL